jgi:hypothetical protein
MVKCKVLSSHLPRGTEENDIKFSGVCVRTECQNGHAGQTGGIWER